MALLYFSSSFILLLLPLALVAADAPAGTLQRSTKQQIIVSIAPNSDHMSVTFLTSPSTKYTALFLRRQTSPGAGGFGNDFCYVLVTDSTGQSVWESDCAPVSTQNTCSLVFTDNGLEVYDGSRSAWNTGVNTGGNNNVQTVELVDEGDMRIRDDSGNLLWRASDNPRANQECGSPGSPGLGGVEPPFAQPMNQNQPFGQSGAVGSGQAAGDGAQQKPAEDGGFKQPLVDHTPFYSGCGDWGPARSVALLASAVVFYCFTF